MPPHKHKQHLLSKTCSESTPGAVLPATYHVMMIEAESLLRGNRFPKIRCRRLRRLSFLLQCSISYTVNPTETKTSSSVHQTGYQQSQGLVLMPARSRLTLVVLWRHRVITEYHLKLPTRGHCSSSFVTCTADVYEQNWPSVTFRAGRIVRFNV